MGAGGPLNWAVPGECGRERPIQNEEATKPYHLGGFMKGKVCVILLGGFMKGKVCVIPAMMLFALLLVPAYVCAFSTVQTGDESEFTIYGFLRNNTGMFTETGRYQENGNQLATERTWLRTYGDFKFNEHFRCWIATQLVYEPSYNYEDGQHHRGERRPPAARSCPAITLTASSMTSTMS